MHTDTEDECKQCATVLEELENIDDEAEANDIPIVKMEPDPAMARGVGIFAYPAVVFFRNFGRDPAVIYSGALKDEAAILNWLMVMKDPLANEPIQDADAAQVAKTIQSFDAVAVIMCKLIHCCIYHCVIL